MKTRNLKLECTTLWTGEMTSWVRALAVLGEDTGSGSSTHMWLTAMETSSSRESNALSDLAWHASGTHRHTQAKYSYT